MNRPPRLRFDRPRLVNRFSDYVENPAQRLVAYRRRNVAARVLDLRSAHEAVRAVHCDRAHGVLAQMLGDFKHQRASAFARDFKRVVDRRQVARLESHVHHRTDYLGNVSYAHDSLLQITSL